MSIDVSDASTNQGLAPVLTTLFDGSEIDVYEMANIRYVPLNVIGDHIYPNSPKQIYKLLKRRSDELEQYTSVGKLPTFASTGEYIGSRDTIFINFKGLLMILMFVRTEQGKKFREFAVEHLAELMIGGKTELKELKTLRGDIKQTYDLALQDYDERLDILEHEKNFFSAEMFELREGYKQIKDELKETKRKLKKYEDIRITAVEADTLKKEIKFLTHYVARIRRTRYSKDLYFLMWEYLKNELIKRKLIESKFDSYKNFTKEQYHAALEILHWTKEDLRIRSGLSWEE